MNGNTKKLGLTVTWLALSAVMISIFGAAPTQAANPTTIASSTMVFEGTLTDEGGGVYSGVLAMVDGAGESAAGVGDSIAGYDVYAENAATAWFGDDPGSGPTWTSLIIADNDGWPSYDVDTPDWYQYSVRLYADGGAQKWAVRNHPGATAANPWYDTSHWGSELPPKGVPMSGLMDWTAMYATETDTGAYLPGTGTPEIPGGAAGKGGGAACWDMDWSWGSEVVPLQHAGFDVEVTGLGGSQYRVTLTPSAPDTVWIDDDYDSSTPGWGLTHFDSIQDGVDAVEEGGTVNVAAGTYNEMVNLDKSVTLLGANAGVHPAVGTHPTEVVGTRGAESILSHNGLYAIRPAADDITVDGFKFTGAGGRIIDTYDDADNFHLTDCIFDNPTQATSQGVIQFGGGSHTDMLIDFNLFQDQGDHTIYTGGGPFDRMRLAYNKFNGLGDGVFWTASPLVDGIVEGNEFDGTIGGTPGQGGTGLNVGQGGNITIRDNWFHDMAYTGFQVGIVGGSVVDNVFEDTHPLQYSGTWYPSHAFELWGGQWGTAVSTNVTITGNTIRFNNQSNATADENGIRLRPGENPGDPGVDAANVHINYNAFIDGGVSSTAFAVRNQGTGAVDAERNWWGDATGPDHASNPHSSPGGGAIDGDADPVPWYATSTTTPSTENVTATHNPIIAVSDTIQGAVDAALSGDTVAAAAGTYEEQVEIAKALTLDGVGDTTVIKSPTSLTKKFTTSNDNYPIVYIHDTTGVTVQQLKVDGAGRGNSNYRFIGIGFRNAGGTVDNVEITDVRDTPFSGAQHGVALYLYNDDSTSRSVTVSNCDIHDFQKNAMALNASDTTPLVVDVHDNDIAGYGATTVTAQNGIQVWADLGSGTIADNTVAGIGYDDPSWVASSILNYYADINVTGNSVSNTHVGLYNVDGAGTISGNSFEVKKIGGCGYGIIATDPPSAVPSPFGEESAGVQALAELSPQAAAATLNVTVSGNTVQFSGTDNASTYGIEFDGGYGPDDLAITADDNEVSGFEVGIEVWQCQSGCDSGVFTGVSAEGNCLSGNDYGLRSNADYITVDADGNWWGDASGPYHATLNPTGSGDEVSYDVDFEPWVTDGCGGTDLSGANWKNLTTGVYDDLQDSLDNASYGDTIQAVGGEPLAGGATCTTDGVTIDLNGKTAGPGSPFLTVTASDVTVLGPGTLDGGGSSDPAILIQSGGDNFILKDVEVTDWADGVEVAASVTSFKMVSNWIHTNAGAGLQIDSGVSFGGIVTVEGNLFKNNTGDGVQNDSGTSFNAEYNSWGHLDGPGSGDGVSADVVYDPWTFAEFYMDMEPDTDASTVTVSEGTTFDVKLKADAEKLYGLSFTIQWDTANLTYNGATFSTAWDGKCQTPPGLATDEIGYFCNLQSYPAPGDPEWDATGGDIVTLSFTAKTTLSGNGPWESFFDIYHAEADTSAGATGGVKVFVNNAGYNSPGPRGDITDTDDGQVTILGKANYTGFVDLQGRPDDSGATLTVYDVADTSTANKLAEGTSAPGGGYTTAHISPHELTVGTTYYLLVDRDLYLPTTAVADSSYAHSKLLDTRPLTTLATLVLLGGDATNNDVVDNLDASCIGGDYGETDPSGFTECGGSGSGGTSDVNGDDAVNLLDLVLMGGNYGESSSPWTP